ncbi:MAG: hypothetical protein RL369_394, partial [Pseudomonadota bacterium]
MNDTEQDIPILTDVIDTTGAPKTSQAYSALPLDQIEETLSQRLI